MGIPAAQPGRRRRLSAAAALLGLVVALGPGASAASAAAPSIDAVWATAVQPTTARLNAEVDPNGLASSFHFDFISKAAYDANVAGGKDGFTGASRVPPGPDLSISGTSPTTINSLVFGIAPGTGYRYRLVTKNADGTTSGAAHMFVTPVPSSFALPDGRGWEMVSPVEKNGGQINFPGTLAAGGVFQAAPNGQSVTYGSAASFGAGAQGAPPSSQYVSSRGAGGWSTLNITPPLLSGSYGDGPDGAPYQLFSPDLARGLLLNGRSCRGEGSGCPVANPPLAGTDAPAGYQNYYLRESATATFGALLGQPDVAELETEPADFELTFAGASPDLRHVALSTCAALTPDAIEVPLGAGCDPTRPNLYKWSAASGLELINLLPAQGQGTPGAALGAQSAAVSSDGSHVYWNDLATGNLYLRTGSQTKQVDAGAGGGGTFETATPDGAIALYTKAGHLWRYDAIAGSSSDLTPGGDVVGVLGASADASHVYYLSGSGLFLHDGAGSSKVADAADASNYPPSTGTARVSADGSKLLFLSTTPLTTSDGLTYDNKDVNTGIPTSQVYLFDMAGSGTLACISCNPTLGRPRGGSSIPGAVANGTTPGSTNSYKPRALSADGQRVFFDSKDALVLSDVNLDTDVYQWEAQGSGSCSRVGGCVALISSGLANRATFIDASSSGADVFFITDRSMVGSDPGSDDLYDARIGGGFPEPVAPSPCLGDACQTLPEVVEDPVLTTVLAGPGNPAEQYRIYGARVRRQCPKGKKLRTVRTKRGKRVKRCVRKRRCPRGKKLRTVRTKRGTVKRKNGKPIKRCVRLKKRKRGSGR